MARLFIKPRRKRALTALVPASKIGERKETEEDPASHAIGSEKSELNGALGLSPRVGKLAFELALSESRRNLDLDVKLFQRQSLLIAAKMQIERDKERLHKQQTEGCGEDDDRAKPANGSAHTGTLSSSSPVSSNASSISSLAIVDSNQQQQENLTPSHNLRWSSHGHRHMRSITQPASSIKAAIDRSMGMGRRESSSSSQPENPPGTRKKNRREGNANEPHSDLEDLKIPEVPPEISGGYSIDDQMSKESREKREAWFQEKAAKEIAQRKEKQRMEAEREAARQIALQESRAQREAAREAKRQQKHEASGPSGFKAWLSWRRGPGKVLSTRKSSASLHEESGRSRESSTEEGDGSGPIARQIFDDDRTEFFAVEHKIEDGDQTRAKEQDWELYSMVQPPKQLPETAATKFSMEAVSPFTDTGAGQTNVELSPRMKLEPRSPPPTSPLPPIPFSSMPQRPIPKTPTEQGPNKRPHIGLLDSLIDGEGDSPDEPPELDEYFGEVTRTLSSRSTGLAEAQHVAEMSILPPDAHVLEGEYGSIRHRPNYTNRLSNVFRKHGNLGHSVKNGLECEEDGWEKDRDEKKSDMNAL